MRKLTSIIVLSVVLSSHNPFPKFPIVKNVPTIRVDAIPIELSVEEIIEIKHRGAFLEAIGFKESSNNYRAVNKFGFLGKYQFNQATLRGLGYKITSEDFLNSPDVQEEAMLKLLKSNKKTLRKIIAKYEGTIQNGIFITESGILAAAHLGGPKSVKKWFKGKNTKDGLGTSISDYMDLFQNYII